MKKCIFCGKELENEDLEFCETCKNFFDWKHDKRFKNRLNRFRDLLRKDKKFNKTKLRREK